LIVEDEPGRPLRIAVVSDFGTLDLSVIISPQRALSLVEDLGRALRRRLGDADEAPATVLSRLNTKYHTDGSSPAARRAFAELL
jgi:hypothetical protein